MSQKIEDILDECLERMLRGTSIEACLQVYPEQVSELEPLLKTAFAFIRESSAIQPAPECKARVYSSLQAMFYARQEKAQRRVRIPIWHRKWALAMTAILGFLLIGVGTVAASAYVLPDEPLYAVKLAGEQVRLTLAFSDTDKAKLHIQFAARRAEEIAEMGSQGKGDEISVLIEQFANHLGQVYGVGNMDELVESGAKAPAATLAPAEEAEAFEERGDRGELETMLSDSRERSLSVLENALEKAPQTTKASLQQAIKIITIDYDIAIYDLGNSSG